MGKPWRRNQTDAKPPATPAVAAPAATDVNASAAAPVRWLITYSYRQHERFDGRLGHDASGGTRTEVIDTDPIAWFEAQPEKWHALQESTEDGRAMSDIVVLLATPCDANHAQGFLRRIVDLSWNDATESTTVPSTDWADRIIQRARQGPTPPLDAG